MADQEADLADAAYEAYAEFIDRVAALQAEMIPGVPYVPQGCVSREEYNILVAGSGMRARQMSVLKTALQEIVSQNEQMGSYIRLLEGHLTAGKKKKPDIDVLNCIRAVKVQLKASQNAANLGFLFDQ
jgi:hypothetical protein